jgi:hypothetical protein
MAIRTTCECGRDAHNIYSERATDGRWLVLVDCCHCGRHEPVTKSPSAEPSVELSVKSCTALPSQ